MAKCEKHGEIGKDTLSITLPIMPSRPLRIKDEVEQEETTFCLRCLIELAKEKIGTIAQ